MAQRAIREYDAKKIMERLWKDYFGNDTVFAGKSVQVEPCTDWDQLKRENAVARAREAGCQAGPAGREEGKTGSHSLERRF